MAALTARAAATRLNKNERTIRRWIHQGLLRASHVATNRFAIDESEIERIQRAQGQATQGDLERRMEQVEREIARLSAQLVAAQTASTRRTTQNAHTAHARTARDTGETLLSEQELPAGSRRASEFAAAHGIGPKTFRYHLLTGLGGQRVEHMAIGKPGRPGEIERWLSPEQQQQALEFWYKHGFL